MMGGCCSCFKPKKSALSPASGPSHEADYGAIKSGVPVQDPPREKERLLESGTTPEHAPLLKVHIKHAEPTEESGPSLGKIEEETPGVISQDEKKISITPLPQNKPRALSDRTSSLSSVTTSEETYPAGETTALNANAENRRRRRDLKGKEPGKHHSALVLQVNKTAEKVKKAITGKGKDGGVEKKPQTKATLWDVPTIPDARVARQPEPGSPTGPRPTMEGNTEPLSHQAPQGMDMPPLNSTTPPMRPPILSPPMPGMGVPLPESGPPGMVPPSMDLPPNMPPGSSTGEMPASNTDLYFEQGARPKVPRSVSPTDAQAVSRPTASVPGAASPSGSAADDQSAELSCSLIETIVRRGRCTVLEERLERGNDGETKTVQDAIDAWLPSDFLREAYLHSNPEFKDPGEPTHRIESADGSSSVAHSERIGETAEVDTIRSFQVMFFNMLRIRQIASVMMPGYEWGSYRTVLRKEQNKASREEQKRKKEQKDESFLKEQEKRGEQKKQGKQGEALQEDRRGRKALKKLEKEARKKAKEQKEKASQKEKWKDGPLSSLRHDAKLRMRLVLNNTELELIKAEEGKTETDLLISLLGMYLMTVETKSTKSVGTDEIPLPGRFRVKNVKVNGDDILGLEGSGQFSLTAVLTADNVKRGSKKVIKWGNVSWQSRFEPWRT